MAKKTITELDSEFSGLKDRLAAVESGMEEKARLIADAAALSRAHEVANSVLDRIEKYFKVSFFVVAALLSVMAAVGYFGLQSLVATAVKDRFESTVVTALSQRTHEAEQELERIKTEARSALDEIQTAKQAAAANPLIVVQTDYGSASSHMSALKGLIYDINPYARIEVLTAEVDDFDVTQAAWLLARSSKYYPPHTIFVSTINPGGGVASPIVLLSQRDHVYIGPDNGGFDLIVDAYGHKASYEITNSEWFGKRRDATRGAYVFAPVAGYLSLNQPVEKVGPKQKTYMPKLPYNQHKVSDRRADGTVMDIDKFGNATTNISIEDLSKLGIAKNGERFSAMIVNGVNEQKLDLVLSASYGDVGQKQPLAIVQESFLQFAINRGDFSEAYKVKRGTHFYISR